MQPTEPSQHVFRDLIKEQRERYTLSYQPADARSSIALLSLFFPEVPRDRAPVTEAMEKELEIWLKKYPVPTKVSPYNASKRLIRLRPNAQPDDCHLMGYVRLLDDGIVRRWGLIREGEIPPETYQADHLDTVYKGLPFRIREEDRVMARLELRYKVKAIAVVLFLILGLPALLQAVIHWGQGLALPLMLASAALGAYKGSGIMGYRRPTKRERRKAELLALKEHYFYHCEKNPRTFARLENENVKREVNRENKEAKRMLQSVTVRKKKKPRQNWFLVPRFFRRGLVRS